jgi:hypothetical protein
MRHKVKMTRRPLPFSLLYNDGDQQLTMTVENSNGGNIEAVTLTLTYDEVDALSEHLGYFLREMNRFRKPERSIEGEDHAEVHGEMLMAQYDDDPNPYHGDYSED